MLNYYQYLHEVYGVSGGDVVLQIAPLTVDASLRDLIFPLTVGAKVVLLDQKQGQDPVIILRKIREHRVTGLLSLSPSRLNSLVESRPEQEAHLDSVRLVLLSGEALHRSLAQRTQILFGHQVSIVNQYGPTECTMTSTYFPITEKVLDQEIIPIGSSITQSQVYLLDPGLNPTSSQSGEIGGHSLLATQVMSRLRNTLEVDIPLRTIFDQPTVEQLGKGLDSLLTLTSVEGDEQGER